MTRYLNSAEGGNAGDTVSTANSGGLSGDAWSAVTIGAGSSLTYSNAAPAHGSRCYQVTAPANVATFLSRTGLATTSCAARTYFSIQAIPSVQIRVLDIRSASATAARVVIAPTGKLSLQDSTGTNVYNFANALVVGTQYRIEVAITQSATAAVMKMDYYLGDSATPAETGYSVTTGNTGSAAISEVRFGLCSATTFAGTLYFDDLAVDNASSNYVGVYTPPTVPAAPTIGTPSAGTANATVPFTAGASGGVGITGYTVTAYISGTSTGITASGTASPIVVAGLTNGQAYTFTVRATNPIGDSSESSASTAVTPLFPTGRLLLNSAEDGTNGTDVSLTNTGSASGDLLNNYLISAAGPTIKFSSTAPAHGSMGYAVAQASGTAAAFIGWKGLAETQLAARCYFRLPALPSIQVKPVQIRSTSAGMVTLLLNTNGKLSVQDATNTNVYNFATALSLNTYYRIEIGLTKSATTATIRCDYYLGDSTTPVETGYLTTTGNTGANNIAEVRFGSTTSVAYVGTLLFDDLGIRLGDNSYVGAYATPPPYVSTTPAVTALHGTAATLSGRVVAAPGTTVSLAWSKSTGAPALTSGATTASPTIASVTAPDVAGGATAVDATYVYTLTATSSDSQTATSTVTLTVPANSAYRGNSGAWKAALPFKRPKSGVWT